MTFCGRDFVGYTALMALVLVGAFSPSVIAEPVVPATHPYREAVQRLESWIALEVKAKGLPALSIALIDDQRILWARGFGFADPKRQVPATADTVYRVGSVSKLFTDLAIMQLVEQGRLDLDAPVGGCLSLLLETRSMCQSRSAN
jgi:CubicO group peptidase (beta-lactamase class C family)